MARSALAPALILWLLASAPAFSATSAPSGQPAPGVPAQAKPGAAPAHPKVAPKPKTVTAKKPAPNWNQLTPQQKSILAPVAGEWDKMPNIQREKLLNVAKTYPKMTPKQQKRITDRLVAWAKLTPEQREIARQQYKKLKKLSPEKREEAKLKWQQYQAQKQEAEKLQAEKQKLEQTGSQAPSSDPYPVDEGSDNATE